jgi:hypothetical protein
VAAKTVSCVRRDFGEELEHSTPAIAGIALLRDCRFMGTDEWERWPKHPDFVAYVESRFENGSGWTYRSVERTIRVSESADIAWFDEVLFSERNGRFRGTGVLILQDDGWKITHYAMSFLILNENWEEVVELSSKTKGHIAR